MLNILHTAKLALISQIFIDFRIITMKRPLSSQCLLKPETIRPKTAQNYSLKKIAALLEKKYQSFENRGAHSSSSKDPQGDKKKRYYVEKSKIKNVNQKQHQNSAFVKVKTFEGLVRSLGINKQASFPKQNNYKNANINDKSAQSIDFEQLNFGKSIQGKRSNTAHGKIRNQNYKHQGTSELIKRFLNLRQGSACRSSPMFIPIKKRDSGYLDSNSRFIPYTHQTEQQKLLDSQLNLQKKSNVFIQRQSFQLFSKPQKLNEKISAKKFLYQNGVKLQKRTKFANLTNKSIKLDKQNIYKFTSDFNSKQKTIQTKGKSCKQFIIDKWEQRQEIKNPLQSFTSLFEYDF